MGKLKIHYTEYESSRLCDFKVIPQKSVEKGVDYYIVELKYNYRVKGKDGKEYDRVDDLLVEHPEVTSTRGLSFRIKDGTKGVPLTFEQYCELEKSNYLNKRKLKKTESSVQIVFDLTNKDHVDLTGVLTDDLTTTEYSIKGFYVKFHEDCIEKLLKIKSDIKLAGNRDKRDMERSFREGNPLYYKKDDKTGLRIAGSSPSRFLKLFTYGNIGSDKRFETKFVVPIKTDGKAYDVLPMNMLVDVEMKFVPLVRFKGLKVSLDKINYEDEILEATIVDIKQANLSLNQEDVLDDYAQDDSVVSNLDENIKLLRELKGKQILETKQKVELTSEKEDLLSVFRKHNEDKKENKKEEELEKEELLENKREKTPDKKREEEDDDDETRRKLEALKARSNRIRS